MDSADRIISSRNPCKFCGAEHKPMSKTICGGWECGSTILFNQLSYSISRSDLCHARANALIPIYLTKEDIDRVVDSLEYHYNLVDPDEHDKNMEIVKKFTDPLTPGSFSLKPSVVKFIDELREANKPSNMSKIKYGEIT